VSLPEENFSSGKDPLSRRYILRVIYRVVTTRPTTQPNPTRRELKTGTDGGTESTSNRTATALTEEPDKSVSTNKIPGPFPVRQKHPPRSSVYPPCGANLDLRKDVIYGRVVRSPISPSPRTKYRARFPFGRSTRHGPVFTLPVTFLRYPKKYRTFARETSSGTVGPSRRHRHST